MKRNMVKKNTKDETPRKHSKTEHSASAVKSNRKPGLAESKVKKSSPEKKTTAKPVAKKAPEEFVIAQTKRAAKPVIASKKLRSGAKKIVVALIVLALLIVVGKLLDDRYHFISEETESDNQTVEVNSDAAVESDVETIEADESSLETNRALAQARLQAAYDLLQTTDFADESVLKLNVPLYEQVYAQSCEAASLRMALSYRNISTTDERLLEMMSYDGAAARTVNGQLVWGDPNEQFVGYRDGNQTDFTGYGVFADPIAAAAERLGRPAAIENDVQIDWIVRQIYAGNPVVLWGVSIKIDDATWQTASGESITVPMRTHTRLVVGVDGDPNEPQGFYVNDPATGSERYWTTTALETNIAQGIKQAVAVY